MNLQRISEAVDQVSSANSRQKWKYRWKKVGLVETRPSYNLVFKGPICKHYIALMVLGQLCTRSSLGKPETSAIRLAGLLWLCHGQSFRVKPWASRGFPAYVWVVMPGAKTSPLYILLSHLQPALPCHHTIFLSESKFPHCVLPTHSTWIIFALAVFHNDPAIWQ